MTKWLVSLMTVLIVLSGCNSKEAKVDANNVPNSMVEVKVKYLTPEKNPNDQPLHLKVEVTQGDEKVEDVSLIQFEVWQGEERTNSVMVDGKQTAKGIYEADVEVKNDAMYSVYAHTEARGLHVMPKGQFIIGEPK